MANHIMENIKMHGFSLTFDGFQEKGAGSRLLLLSGVGSHFILSQIGIRQIQLVHVLQRAVKHGLRVVDGADGASDGCRRATVGLIHPGSFPKVIQFARYCAAQLIFCPVIEVLHCSNLRA